MLRPRARVGRALVVRRRRGLVTGLLLALLLGLAGCGSGPEEDKDEPSKAELSCRDKWADLETLVEGRDSKTNPSALASRWTSIAATVDYYATSARASDCGKTIEDQEKAMADLSAFGTKLAPYDMELRLVRVEADAEEYAAGPTPAPEPSPKKNKNKNKKKQKRAPAPPPSPAAVAKALKTISAQAPVATQEQGPGWQQAAVIDLGDTAAVTKTLKDLAFLSSESPAYEACRLALAQINAALHPVKTR